MLFDLEDYAPTIRYGCMDRTADNYLETISGVGVANTPCDNNCCKYTGCMDPKADNYDVKFNVECLDCCRYTIKPLIEEATTNTVDPITKDCCLKLNETRTDEDIKYYTEWYMLSDVNGVERCVRRNIWNYRRS